jgi:hypothetical protein
LCCLVVDRYFKTMWHHHLHFCGLAMVVLTLQGLCLNEFPTAAAAGKKFNFLNLLFANVW